MEADRWQDKYLPEAMRAEPELATFADIGALAQGYVDTRNFARGRVALPKDGDAASFAEFAAKLRPEKPEDYQLNAAEGADAGLADAMRPIFHELGLLPTQATQLVDKWNVLQGDLASKGMQAAKDEVTAIEVDMGPSAFEQRRQAVQAMLGPIIRDSFGEDGDSDDVMIALEQAYGAGKAIKIMFALAERTGELAKVDPLISQKLSGQLTPENAEKRLNDLQKNSEWMTKVEQPGSAEGRERQSLLDAMKAGLK